MKQSRSALSRVLRNRVTARCAGSHTHAARAIVRFSSYWFIFPQVSLDDSETTGDSGAGWDGKVGRVGEINNEPQFYTISPPVQPFRLLRVNGACVHSKLIRSCNLIDRVNSVLIFVGNRIFRRYRSRNGHFLFGDMFQSSCGAYVFYKYKFSR